MTAVSMLVLPMALRRSLAMAVLMLSGALIALVVLSKRRPAMAIGL
jgi:hypothetical protein